MTASTPEASLDTNRLRVLVGFSAICLTELIFVSRMIGTNLQGVIIVGYFGHENCSKNPLAKLLHISVQSG